MFGGEEEGRGRGISLGVAAGGSFSWPWESSLLAPQKDGGTVADTCPYSNYFTKCLEERKRDSDVGHRWRLQLENRSRLVSSRLPSPPLLLLLDMFIIRVPTFQLLKKTIDSSMLCFGASFDMITLSDADENRFYRELHPFITRCCCTYTSILHICLYPVILKKQSSGFLYFSC